MTDGLYKTDDGAALRFWQEAKQNGAASERHGRPIFDNCLMVEVITPGSRESAPVFELERVFAKEVGIDTPRRSHKYDQYAKQIEAWRTGSANSDMTGTPLEAWPAMDAALVATCKAAGVFTVDALAVLPDSRLHILGPGARGWTVRAQAFIDAANGNAAGEAQAVENAALKARIAELEAAIASMKAGDGSAKPAEQPPTPPSPPVAEQSPPAPPSPPAPKPTKPKAGGNTAPAMPII